MLEKSVRTFGRKKIPPDVFLRVMDKLQTTSTGQSQTIARCDGAVFQRKAIYNTKCLDDIATPSLSIPHEIAERAFRAAFDKPLMGLTKDVAQL